MADKEKEEKDVFEKKLEDETMDMHPDCDKQTDSCQDTSCELAKEEAAEHNTNADSTSSEQFEEEEALKKFEVMFKNRFTELDPGYLPYKSSNDAEAIPVVERFAPPWNSQNRRGAFHGRGHGSRQHHQHNRYKRRHEEYRSNDNKRGRDSYHSNHQRERQNWQRQDHYYGHRQNEHFMQTDSRDQGYRRY
ncbi:RNA guanine-N7 methyltransferase activating subunit-like [Anneissia japonica]|uniref:RNA guanine-N7 methyltransferase activating subunit-like n=1 Tax=Anneissia japonica TaxID=1529436 RepID=UPI0014254B2F|nr:RNA guanine-N7 methyltransferase activating subunit-like [Anneissia japonica]